MVSTKVFTITIAVLILVSVFSGYYIHILMGVIADLETQLSDWMRRYNQLNADYRELAERYSVLSNQYSQLKAKHTDLQSKYERLSEDYSTLKSQHEDLLGRYSRLEADYKNLANQYNALLQDYQSLSGRYTVLLQEFSELRKNYTALQNSYNTLMAQYNALLRSYNELKTNYESLRSSYAQLQSQYQSLLSDYNDLMNRYVALNSSYTSLLNSYGSLKSNYEQLLSRYNDLASKYSTLYNEYTALLNKYNYFINWYYNLANQVNVRISPYLENVTMFITPDDPLVVSLMYNVTGGWGNPSDWDEYWSDIFKLYKWVVNNIRYSYDSPEPLLPDVWGTVFWWNSFWRFPNETIRDGTGDCEDQANLLASLILAYNGKRYDVWALYVVFDNGAHVAVVIPVKGGKIAILDPAGMYYTSTWLGSLTAKDVATELQNYFQYWASGGYPNGRVYAIYSYNMYKKFNSNEEFIQYVRSVTS